MSIGDLSRRGIFSIGGAIAACSLLPVRWMPARAENRWESLPEFAPMPAPTTSGYVDVNDITMWYATFGDGSPLILLHGGFGNSEHWGGQISEFAKHFKVIALDSRGHGRSTRSAQPYSYELMASDVIALMDKLQIQKASVVGVSDGGIIGLAMAIHNPERLDRLVVFGANYDPTGMKDDWSKQPTVVSMRSRVRAEYKQLSKTPDDYDAFRDAMLKMWDTEPNFSADQLRGIRVRTAIVDGEYDEFVKRPHTEQLASLIPGSELIILPNVSHFAIYQDAPQFNAAVLGFLTKP